ncbi:MAG: hypothetical protein WDO13_05410 [Verrucomicrobiota bacterium]
MVILAGVLTLVGFAVFENWRLDKSSHRYVEGAIPPIVDHWSKDELEKRESPDFGQGTSDADLARLFAKFSRLGAVRGYHDAIGEASIRLTSGGLRITAAYRMDAIFQNGPASILVSLVRINHQWAIAGFRVDSPLFPK